jgi:hypothetical protein
MKKSLILVVLVLAAVGAGGARGDGGLPATVITGGRGVLAPSGKVRYVTLTTGRQTIVAVVRVNGGQVMRWRFVRGFVGVPTVGLDGTTDGVSRDGRTLVLASTVEGTRDGALVTRFAVIDTKTLKLRRIELPGAWSYDAVSPDASSLFLVQYLANVPNAAYRVRVYELTSGRLIPEAIVDRREEEASMRGRPVTRVSSGDGRWAYTLYARARKEPFVHALDTVNREAFCIDLPLEVRLGEQIGLRLRLSGDRLAVHRNRSTLAVIDTERLAVTRS